MEPRTLVEENIVIEARRVVSFKDFEWALGMSYWNATSRALGSNMNFTLGLAYNITDHWSIHARHYSNAGSARPNMGQDALTLRYTF